ncbi:valine--tRNA ligase [Acetivibrio sp. MSJd-27]|uniref:valine--tRNA ligase n=1 Tax=Acetivibrio sp. MSJd-27 TaxID=2841523 RepID=UPI001C1175AC|nr:valine--tRNA ligase [Acetivibrio sp. MSJd-27]MBU5450305.1 valine--tRNA ligase [Acetivibrio sp. MSJd-27]
MRKELAKNYDPKDVEEKIYDTWLKNGYFTPQMDKKKEPFTIVIPPPNVTGHLHMGHALDETLQDILMRYKRMQGFCALWVPGTDHAGIATQIKVEEVLRKEEGLTRHDLGREKFLERVWDFKEKHGNYIMDQIKKLGSSCDFSRERFTMDEGCSKAVKEVFVNLYEKGLIYRGNKIINWCPHCITALSDAEVEHEDQAGAFWHIKYPVKDSDEFVIVATTRPETMFGDTAVAVHPDDERYTHLVGKTLILPLVNREIPVIADDYVDKEFGTGCVKITPSHDPNDFEVGLRHNLEQIRVMNDDATLNQYAGKYEGMDRYEARKAVVADLEAEGLLLKTEPHSHNVGICYRCGTTVEPITSRQWFVKMEPLAKKAIEVVEKRELEFVPDRFSKIYMNWMENVHDWCISRQLWWGHQIPAYYCDACGEMVVSKEKVHTCPKCGGKMRQEEDVLDTWFSSALWPFSTLGWPEKTKEMDYFFPTSVLVTGYDIIFFWVARMIFSSLEHTGKIPFRHVFIHGLVRDSQGRKMSKSLGNGIDPLEIIDKYGADTLRFTLANGNSPGNDMRFYIERVEAARNYANKIWNASRFVLMNLEIDKIELPAQLEMEDKWILSKYNTLVKEVTENLDRFELGVALAKLYDFSWDLFCDWYIEMVKPRLYEKGENAKTAQNVLAYVLSGFLKMIHPFMPFITEEIFQSLPVDEESIMVSKWPEFDEKLCFEAEEKAAGMLISAITGVRNIRAEMNVPMSKKAQMFIKTKEKDAFEKSEAIFLKLAGASGITVTDDMNLSVEDSVSVVSEDAEILIPLGDLVDFEKEIERLEKEKNNVLGEIDRVEKKLSNHGFLEKAPAKLVENEKAKKEKYTQMLQQIESRLESYRK